MRRRSLIVLAALVTAVPVVASCGSDGDASGQTLPPIATTTSTTLLITTTTEWVPVTYEIQPGDSLAGIAAKFQTSLDKLAILNGITNPDAIEAGDVLDIPPPTVPAGASSTTTTATTSTTTG